MNKINVMQLIRTYEILGGVVASIENEKLIAHLYSEKAISLKQADELTQVNDALLGMYINTH